MTWTVELTGVDHEQNGFVSLARFKFLDEAAARAFVDAVDDMIPDEAEPDPEVEPYTLLLDLHDCDIRKDGANMVDNSKSLPLQIAMRLAPNIVETWLRERPDPNVMPQLNTWGRLLPVPGGIAA